MNSIFEKQRQLLTEIDFHIKNSSDLLYENNLKNRIFKEHLIAKNLSIIQFNAKNYLNLQADKALQEQALNKITNTGDDLPEFYALVNKLKSEYADGNDLLLPGPEESGERDWDYDKMEFEKLFSGEEGLGHYLDLVEFYNRFLNLKAKRITYLAYVRVFYDLEKIPEDSKRANDYKR